MKSYQTFYAGIAASTKELKTYGTEILTESWQGMDIKDQERYTMREIINWDFQVLNVPDDLNELRKLIQPDLPWADDHFKERVAGVPLNPGEQYKNWRFFKNSPGADEQFRKDGGKFSHTYMERYWPKHANTQEQYLFEAHGSPLQQSFAGMNAARPLMGIRYEYGDLQDVVRLLQDQPNTRQAYLPIWFPEDTGAIQKQRVPCTLGYLFYYKFGKLNVNYYIRACDAFKHFRNDIYLTTRLLLWVLEELRKGQSHEDKLNWHKVIPGTFTMYIANFHAFKSEINLI